MTGYHIEIGYNPTRGDHDEMWRLLRSEARRIADQPSVIIAEAERLNAPCVSDDGECELGDYADIYKEPFGSPGHPVRVVEDGDNRQIMQMASTDAGLKYHVRRAYARLLIEAMHRHGIEVSLMVA